MQPQPVHHGAPARIARALATGIVDILVSMVCRVQVEGRAHVPLEGAVLIAGNHVNPLEAPVVARAVPRAFQVVISDHLRRRFLLGRLLDVLYEVVWVNRMKGRPQLVQEAAAVFAVGRMLIITPEGRYSWNGVLGYGDQGPALLALTAGVPVLPVATDGLERVLPSLRRLRRATVTVRFGAPFRLGEPIVPTEHDLSVATEQIMRTIAQLLPVEKRGRWKA